MWESTSDSPVSWWHMSRARRNCNAFYSPGVDRFFAVDSFDPYTANEIAQILSSKVPGIGICLLHKDDPFLTWDNCHEYTLINKNIFFNGASILFARQWPALRKMKDPSLKHEPVMPTDYQDPERAAAFAKLQEYSKLVIRAWHVAKLTEMHFNFMPLDDYASAFYYGIIPDEMTIPADNSNTGSLETGITKEIRRILYYSESVEEALTSIEQMWLENNTPLTVNWRAMFYRLMELPVPTSLATGEVDYTRYSGYIL